MASIPEVSEAEADATIQAVFAGIKSTLGIGAVGSVFRRLAVYPWYLQLAWRNLQPNASIIYFQRSARELREHALHGAGGHGGKAPEGETNAGRALDGFLDLESRLLMAVTALRAGANGQTPKMNLISAQDMRVASPEGTPGGGEASSAIDATPSEEQQSFLDRFRGLAESGSDARLLLSFAGTFAPRLTAAEEKFGEDGLARRADRLRRMAASAGEALPYRMEISATACRQSGLTEDQIDAVRSIIDQAWQSLPRSLLIAAALTSAGGARVAEREQVLAG